MVPNGIGNKVTLHTLAATKYKNIIEFNYSNIKLNLLFEPKIF